AHLHSLPFLFFFFSAPTPPRAPLFPYTTLFRSNSVHLLNGCPNSRARKAQTPKSTANTTSMRLTQQQQQVIRKEVTRAFGCCVRSEEHTSELQSRFDLVCRLLLEKKK